MMLNLSDTYLSMFDLEDLDAPVAQAEVEIAPDVEELFRYGDHLVEHVRTEGYAYGYDTQSEFRIKPVGGDVNATAAIARFGVGQVQRVMKWKHALVVFRRKTDPSSPSPGSYYDNQQSQIVVFDLGHLPRREAPRHQPAELGVVGRVEHDHRGDLVEAGQVHVAVGGGQPLSRREPAGVAGRGHHATDRASDDAGQELVRVEHRAPPPTGKVATGPQPRG